jgi:hypothetical protein
MGAIYAAAAAFPVVVYLLRAFVLQRKGRTNLPVVAVRFVNVIVGLNPLLLLCRTKSYSLQAPPANLGLWNDVWVARSNCYAAALAVHRWRSCAVGSGALWSKQIPPELLGVDEYGLVARPTGPQFLARLMGDGLTAVTLRTWRLFRQCHLVAAFLDVRTGKYHFVRRGPVRWMHKNGDEPAEEISFTAALTGHGKPYLLVGYFWVPPNCAARVAYAEQLGVEPSALARQ